MKLNKYYNKIQAIYESLDELIGELEEKQNAIEEKAIDHDRDMTEKEQERYDEIDEQLLTILAKRMRISKEIGIYKKEHNMPILQSGRYNDILENRAKQGQSMNLSPDFVTEIMKSIHEESVKVQMEIMK